MAEVTSLAAALARAQGRGLARLDAQLLLLHALGRSEGERAWLIAHDSAVLAQEPAQRFEALTARRLAGEPIAYLLGQKEFFGLSLAVDQRVLIPRPDTETLVEWAIEVLRHKPGARVVDLGTGSGAIALALKQGQPNLQVWAVDCSTEALQVARENARRLQLAIEFVQASWLTDWPQPTGLWDAIISNPPYIRQDDPHLKALTYEPQSALVAGVEGLDDLRLIISQAADCLRPGGHVLLEHGYDQAVAVRRLLREAGFSQVESRCDLSGIERCSGGVMKAEDQNPPRLAMN